MALIRNIRELWKHGSAYMASWMINSIVRLALLPVFTRYLNRDEYGTLAILDSVINLVRIVCALGLASAMIRFYHEYSSDEDKKRTISTGVITLVIIAVVSGYVLYLFRVPLSSILLGDGGSVVYFSLCAATMIFSLIRSGTDAYLMAEKASLLFVVANSGQAILNAVLNVFLVCVKGLGVFGMLVGNLAAACIVNAVLVIVVLRKVSVAVDQRILMKMLRFSAPLVVSVLAAAGMHELDRFFIRYYSSMAEVGLYSLAYQFPFMLNAMFAGSFERIWAGSIMYEIAQSPDAKHQYKKVATYYMLVLGFALFIVSIAARTIVTIFAAPEYIDAAKYIPLIALGIWLYAFHIFVRVGVMLTKKTYLFPINYSIALIINIITNLILVPSLGAMGAAIATVITYGYFSIGGFYIYKRVYPMDFEWLKLGAILLFGILLVCLKDMCHANSFWVEILVEIVFISLFPMILISCPNFLTRRERKKLFNFAHMGLLKIANVIK